MSSNPFSPLSTMPRDQSSSPANTAAPRTASPVAIPDTASSSKASTGRRKKHRGGRRKRTRRESFAPLQEDNHRGGEPGSVRDVNRESLYELQRNTSQSSLDIEVLETSKRHRSPHGGHAPSSLGKSSGLPPTFARQVQRRRTSQVVPPDRDIKPWDESTPLLSTSHRIRHAESAIAGSGFDPRRGSSTPSVARPKSPSVGRPKSPFNVNYPPSMPATPTLGPDVGLDMSFGDVLIRDKLAREESPDRLSLDERQDDTRRSSPSPPQRRKSVSSAKSEEEPPRYAAPELSEVAEEGASFSTAGRSRPRRRRRTPWPDLEVLEGWMSYEKEQENSRRVKRITEPQLINGRLRAVHKGWHRSDDDMPYRFTYFNEDLQSTIHSQTISGLIQAGGSFRELFVPDPRVLSDDESGDEDEEWGEEDFNPFTARVGRPSGSPGRASKSPFMPPPAWQGSGMTTQGNSEAGVDVSRAASRERRPVEQHDGAGRAVSPAPFPKIGHQTPNERPGSASPKYGDRPVWWLDVLSPTEAEMKVISQAFGIHPLTAEDIMVQEAREKVELFRSYYFVNYRTFDQDPQSGNYMDPVNVYSVVFREGIITFHFSMTPHPANVRRRIRQLKDYLIVSSDWISYAIVDDITDVFGPIIQGVEEEVDDIDEAIMNSWGNDKKKEGRDDEKGGDDTVLPDLSRGDVLRRVGDCRKRVMSLYRLLGSKADVIKGFAKRCNEQYMVAPHSDIGLYLGDIQDHIITMTSNLSHYEKILSRAHANYLAHINCKMTERSEETADSLNKLTVLGTIVLPMNIITGLWGMNVWVPGQEYEGDLTWFVCITIGLIAFGFSCYAIAKRVYGL